MLLNQVHVTRHLKFNAQQYFLKINKKYLSYILTPLYIHLRGPLCFQWNEQRNKVPGQDFQCRGE